MNEYFVTTDMTADFPPELAEEDFRILPMSYVLDGVEYDGKTRPFLPLRDFYSALEQGKTPPRRWCPSLTHTSSLPTY